MAMKLKTGEQYLHERQPNLHLTAEVEGVADYLRQNGERIPNEPDKNWRHTLVF